MIDRDRMCIFLNNRKSKQAKALHGSWFSDVSICWFFLSYIVGNLMSEGFELLFRQTKTEENIRRLQEVVMDTFHIF